MSSYYREQGYHSRRRFFRRLRYIWALLLLAIIITGGFFALDVVRQAQRTEEASNESRSVTKWITTDTQLQTSPYFQFQSPKNWRAIAAETKPNHFVYRQFNGHLVEQELIVDINRESAEVLALVQTTRVLPVRVVNGGKLVPETAVSEHCKTGLKQPGIKNPLVITFKQVTFACNPDSTSYIAVIGSVGGSDSVVLTRPDGSKAAYNIMYKNLTAQPTAGDFENIIESFEAR